MKQYKITLVKREFIEEKLFNTKKEMEKFVKENEAYIIKLEEIITKDILTQYVNTSNKNRYSVNINLLYDDSDYCSQVDDQWNYIVLANNESEAEEIALEQASKRLEDQYDYKYLEIAYTTKVEYDETREYNKWKEVK